MRSLLALLFTLSTPSEGAPFDPAVVEAKVRAMEQGATDVDLLDRMDDLTRTPPALKERMLKQVRLSMQNKLAQGIRPLSEFSVLTKAGDFSDALQAAMMVEVRKVATLPNSPSRTRPLVLVEILFRVPQLNRTTVEGLQEIALRPRMTDALSLQIVEELIRRWASGSAEREWIDPDKLAERAARLQRTFQLQADTHRGGFRRQNALAVVARLARIPFVVRGEFVPEDVAEPVDLGAAQQQALDLLREPDARSAERAFTLLETRFPSDLQVLVRLRWAVDQSLFSSERAEAVEKYIAAHFNRLILQASAADQLVCLRAIAASGEAGPGVSVPLTE